MILDKTELCAIWQKFLEKKISTTELEKAREELEALPEKVCADDDDLTEEKFLESLFDMKHRKSPGPDQIPAEVWQIRSWQG